MVVLCEHGVLANLRPSKLYGDVKHIKLNDSGDFHLKFQAFAKMRYQARIYLFTRIFPQMRK
jgi:hypothetical protein